MLKDGWLLGFLGGYAKLKGYQRVGVRWLLALAKLGHGGILADEMGLGKTAQAQDICFKSVLRLFRFSLKTFCVR